ncbi:response regulator transcription factor [Nitratifractor sp.]
MTNKPLILLIEDQEDILEIEELYLQNAGYETLGFLSTRGVRQALEEEEVALLVVDRNLPGVEGSEFVASLRAEGIDLPVIFVTAKDQDEQVLEGFERGGDDYLKKPFNMQELVARVRALLRRSGVAEEESLRYRNLRLDPESHRLWRDGEELHPTRLEFELLHYFLRQPGRVISREELLEEVWPEGEDRGLKSVNVAVNRLKKKIEIPGESPYIEAVRGVGYRLC